MYALFCVERRTHLRERSLVQNANYVVRDKEGTVLFGQLQTVFAAAMPCTTTRHPMVARSLPRFAEGSESARERPKPVSGFRSTLFEWLGGTVAR